MHLLHDVHGLEMAILVYYVTETIASASYLQPCNANLLRHKASTDRLGAVHNAGFLMLDMTKMGRQRDVTEISTRFLRLVCVSLLFFHYDSRAFAASMLSRSSDHHGL